MLWYPAGRILADTAAFIAGRAIAERPLAGHGFGRDVLARVVWGARASLLAGVVSVAISLSIPAGLSALIPGLQPILTSTIANRWLGGLLTNWRTISDRIAYLHDLRRLKSDGQLALLPAKRQNLLFSATFSDEIRRLAEDLLDDPAYVEVARRNQESELVTRSIISRFNICGRFLLCFYENLLNV